MSKNLKALYSHKSDEWSTPQDLFDRLNAEFNFTLDVSASENNHKCERYYTVADNGLEKSWSGERVFCNPPYSAISEWVAKSWRESFNPNTLVVMLIPARTDTRYFHDYILNRSEIRFIRSRLKFVWGGGTLQETSSAPFPSMLVIFRSAGVK